MSLSVDIRHCQGDFRLEARFESTGRLTALFGRSGAGKSTLALMSLAITEVTSRSFAPSGPKNASAHFTKAEKA